MMKDSTMSVADTDEEFNPVQESSPTEDQEENNSLFESMQTELHSKGAVLTKAWSDLFSFITKYQAELVVKENTVEIAEKEIEQRKKQLEQMKPAVEAGNEEISKLQDEILSKEKLLGKAQSELAVKEQLLGRVQSDLSCNMELLEKSKSTLSDNRNELMRYRGDVKKFKSELSIKQEQLLIKDNLLKKVENQLMKENTELKEQLELERQSHELTKRSIMSHSQTERSRKKLRTSATYRSSDMIEIPDLPSALDLSTDQDFGFENILSMAESQSNHDSFPLRRLSSGLELSRISASMTSASSSFSDHSSRLHHMPASTTATHWSVSTPTKPSPRTSMSNTCSISENISQNDTTAAMTSSDTFFPLSVGASGIDNEVPVPVIKPGTPSSGTNDSSDQGPMPVSGPIPSTTGITSGGSMEGEGKLKIPRRIRLMDYYSPRWKPFACPHCPMMCSVAGNLKTHMRRHSGERPYKCPACPRRFARSDARMRHVRLHTGERPYTCRFCDRRFVESGNLRKHMLAVHGTTINLKPPM